MSTRYRLDTYGVTEKDEGMTMPGNRLGLVAARKATGLSQERLAERMDVERSTVQRWEAGQSTPQPWHRPKLATVLGISHDRLAELLADQPCADDQVSNHASLVDGAPVRRCWW